MIILQLKLFITEQEMKMDTWNKNRLSTEVQAIERDSTYGVTINMAILENPYSFVS